MYKLLFSMLLLLSFLGYSFSENSSQGKEIEKFDITKQSIEEKAPDFVLEDINGKKVKLSDYKGKLILLVFSTTWCPYCRAEIPHFKKLYSQYKGKEFEIFNIDIQESKRKVASFAEKYELPYKVLLDSDGKVAYTYGVRGVPTKILISKDGIILCRECRSVDILLENQLDKATKNE